MSPATCRVIAYVDGFNLYYGLRSNEWRKYYWLDLVGLSRSLMKPGQKLVHVHYFSARIRGDGAKKGDAKRQSTYLDALSASTDLTIHFGHYLQKERTCRKCGATWKTDEEKMTDVNIASQLLEDGFDEKFATALVISGDSDLTTPIDRLRARFSQLRIIIVFPPNRRSHQLMKAAHGHMVIGEDKLRQNQLPPTITMPNGHLVQRPDHWK
ncbi:MAG: NYN domain-containing protein [Magnetococcales bacterium]|nr:NYN domain-containing protein [Magnetococcales bacterium]